jgi:hypothetical protein
MQLGHAFPHAHDADLDTRGQLLPVSTISELLLAFAID